jgi:hypothetical protein
MNLFLQSYFLAYLFLKELISVTPEAFNKKNPIF